MQQDSEKNKYFQTRERELHVVVEDCLRLCSFFQLKQRFLTPVIKTERYHEI